MTNKTEETDKYKEELFDSFYVALPDYFKTTEIHNQVRSAYDFAYKAHYGVRRKGGRKEPYITHPVAVALITANEIGLGVSSVISALLHDVVEDTEYTREDIQNHFGDSVANIVEGLTKITNVYDAKQNAQAETFKKMLLSIPHDYRVAFIKIADRLHNMRTMDDIPDGTRQIKAGENLYVYVPIAYQLGLFEIKNELEDRSFKYTHPAKFDEMSRKVAETAPARNELFGNFKMNLMRVLVRTKYSTCKLSVIQKSLFQTWTKMQSMQLKFEEINNFDAVRVIFDTTNEDAQEIVTAHYGLYSAIINNFTEKLDSKRDYVINPKKNGFKALVFQVMFGGSWIEVQLLTKEADMIARRGYTIHKSERTGLDSLKQNLGSLDPQQDAEDLMTRFKSLSSVSTIYVFTPKGDILELPKGATVLDFAFQIHTNLGYTCLGASVDKKLMPINYVLKTTDQVEVLTSPGVKPIPSWLEFVITEKAKTAINEYFKHSADSKADVINGKLEFNKLMASNKLIPYIGMFKQLLNHYKLSDNDTFYEHIAHHLIEVNELLDFIKKVKSERKKNDSSDTDPDCEIQPLVPRGVCKRDRNTFVEIDYKKPLYIDSSIPYMPALCCLPIPGDEAYACTDDDGVVFIHKRECDCVRKKAATEGKKTARVIWGDNCDQALAAVSVQGIDRVGLVKDLADELYLMNIPLKSIELTGEEGVFQGSFQIYVTNLNQLEELIARLTCIQGILKANRTNCAGEMNISNL